MADDFPRLDRARHPAHADGACRDTPPGAAPTQRRPT